MARITKAELEEINKRLEDEKKELKKTIEELTIELQELKKRINTDVKQKHNERKAGRKPSIKNKNKDKVIQMHLIDKKSMMKIAYEIGIGYGTVNTIIKKYKEEQKNNVETKSTNK